MSNFADDILSAAGDEPILSIAISKERGSSWATDKPDHNLGSAPVPWNEAFPVLNYEYDTGYGAQDCHDVWAWTPTRVLFVWEYDGSTSIASVPRAPGDFAKWRETNG